MGGVERFWFCVSVQRCSGSRSECVHRQRVVSITISCVPNTRNSHKHALHIHADSPARYERCKSVLQIRANVSSKHYTTSIAAAAAASRTRTKNKKQHLIIHRECAASGDTVKAHDEREHIEVCRFFEVRTPSPQIVMNPVFTSRNRPRLYRFLASV